MNIEDEVIIKELHDAELEASRKFVLDDEEEELRPEPSPYLIKLGRTVERTRSGKRLTDD
jgi:hypothetical protein